MHEQICTIKGVGEVAHSVQFNFFTYPLFEGDLTLFLEILLTYLFLEILRFNLFFFISFFVMEASEKLLMAVQLRGG